MKCDEKRLEEIAARASAAVSGPWYAHPHRPPDLDACDGITTAPGPDDRGNLIVETDSANYPPDLSTAQFIAHARTDVPDLISDLQDERAETKRLRALINRDRTGLAAGLNAVSRVVAGYSWLPAGEWGSYTYEQQTEETLRREIGQAFSAIEGIATRHLHQSGARADAAFNGGPGPSESV